ncbi:restriction endonuclease fold toxin-2 domain-containing protein [Streptomyces sp. NPDC046876]|uniref:restriction endonuclease fold toxin-2 domain-containing protein n=1 Tax=Streptomyces sp. NPDC046876 TaxID=3155616 RepID=UPI0033F1AE8B
MHRRVSAHVHPRITVRHLERTERPRNTQMRGVETITNNPDSAAHWRVMMAAYGDKGYARYAP